MLARHYGLASQSTGEGGRRRVELFKFGGGGGGGMGGGSGGQRLGSGNSSANGFYGDSVTAATAAASFITSSNTSTTTSNTTSNDGFLPPFLLSTTANRLTLADVERAEREAKGYALCLVDVEPRADLAYLLRRFAESGLLKGIEGPDERGSAVVRFTRAAGLREALDQLGGGMRGAFRIDRLATLRANEAVLGMGSSGSSSSGSGAAGTTTAAVPPSVPSSRPFSTFAGDPHDRMASIEAAFAATGVSSGGGYGRGNSVGAGAASSSSSSARNNNPPSAAAVAAAAAELGNGWKLASDFDWADDE